MKINYVSILWCNYQAYDEARWELVDYAHACGIKVLGFFVPYRPSHEQPPRSISNIDPLLGHADCPRDAKVRQWYFDRLTALVTREPKIDMIQIESPYHDGVYCHCEVCRGRKHPYPEDKLLEEMVRVVRRHRPEMPVVRGMKQPLPDTASAVRLAEQLRRLEEPHDWHLNTYADRAHRRRWHDLGSKFATYLRLYRSALKGRDVARDIDFLFRDFRMSSERDIVAHQFCYRACGGRLGSFPVEQDQEMRTMYPDRKGPLSLALAAEAAFDPFVKGTDRSWKIARIRALTIPDYPHNRKATDAEWKALRADVERTTSVSAPIMQDPAATPAPSRLFRTQYCIREPRFLIAQVCADLDNDGSREVVYSSRGTKATHLLRASDGMVLWSINIPGNHESIMAYDLDRNGDYEILFTVSGGPDAGGHVYKLDQHGRILGNWASASWKVGNTPTVIDADGDGVLEGFIGTRSTHFVRLNLETMTEIASRFPWSQCGCHTSAIDVDHDGRWDLFAGQGDDRGEESQGVLHRLNPLTLESVWSYRTMDNATTGDMVLADIDGDGQVEIVKSVDSSHNPGNDQHFALYAFETDGTLLWKNETIHEMYSPNVADLDGDGQVEIVGITFDCEVYCLDGNGLVKWRRHLRPEINGHTTLTPILCDHDGDQELEILAATNGRFFRTNAESSDKPNGIIFALSARGDILDRYDVGSPRYWGFGFLCNVDDDPQMELIASGSGGVDVIETRGLRPNTEHFMRRKTYQRNNVVPWAYRDSYFIYRGRRQGVQNLTDNLVLAQKDGRYRSTGSFTTELFTLPPDGYFDRITCETRTPAGTEIRINLLDGSDQRIHRNLRSGAKLQVDQPVRLEFLLSTTNESVTPILDSYSLTFALDADPQRR